jgi:hypothetical protein
MAKGLNHKSPDIPMYVFSHHKTSTVLAGKALNELSDLLGLNFCKVYCYSESIFE